MRDHKFRLLLLAASTLGAAAPAGAADFAKDVQPILESSCYACHGEKLQMGGLRLDAKKLALAGGKATVDIDDDQANHCAERARHPRSLALIGDTQSLRMATFTGV